MLFLDADVKSRPSSHSAVSYRLAANPTQFRALVLGRRKAIEVSHILLVSSHRLIRSSLSVATREITFGGIPETRCVVPSRRPRTVDDCVDDCGCLLLDAGRRVLPSRHVQNLGRFCI
jgi:hypothetical protein